MGVFGYDLTDPALFDNGFPHKVFTGIRRDCPVAWHDPPEFGAVTDGFWSIAGHPDVVTVLEHCEVLSAPSPTFVDDALALVVLELVRHPLAWATLRLQPGLLATGVDELARWVCPTAAVWCRAHEELTLGRHRIGPGDPIVCWLPSANRDERTFGRDAMDLRLDRAPNPHLSFLGQPDARERLSAALAELVAHTSSLRLTGEPEWRRDPTRCVLEQLPVELVPVT